MIERVRIGHSKVRLQYLDDLQEAWRSHRLALFVGAGISIPHGIPNWNALVLELVLEDSKRIRSFSPAYRKALGAWLVDYFEFSPLMLARLVKYYIRCGNGGGASPADIECSFRDRLRRILYANYTPCTGGSDTLNAVAELIARSVDERRIPLVISFNFDDLLERRLREMGLEVESVHSRSHGFGKGLPIVHAHGFIPSEDQPDTAGSELIFTEDDYHRMSNSPFHWAVGEIASCLRKYTALMIGLSMSDPSLRRIFDAVYDSGKPRHFLLRKDYALDPWEEYSLAAMIQQRVEKTLDPANPEPLMPPSQVVAGIRSSAEQAHTFDRNLFQDLGVGTIWLKTWSDVAPLLHRIAGSEDDGGATACAVEEEVVEAEVVEADM